MFERPLPNASVEATEERAGKKGGGTRAALFVVSFILGAAGLLSGRLQILDRAAIAYADVGSAHPERYPLRRTSR